VAKIVPMTPGDVRQRAATAREHLQVAEERYDWIKSSTEPSAEAQVPASNAVSAAIAACDAICGSALGERANDHDHRAAVALLKTVLPGGSAFATRFARIIRDKSLLQYGTFCTPARALAILKDARVLVAALDDGMLT
jgi:hypothetical protein